MGRVHQLEVEAEPGARIGGGGGPGEVLVAAKVMVEVRQHVVREDREEDREVLVVMAEAEVEAKQIAMVQAQLLRLVSS